MDWCNRIILPIALIVTWSACAQAGDDFPLDIVAEACLKEERLEICRNLGLVKDNSEKYANNKLRQWGLLNSAVVVGTIAQIATKKQFEIRDRSDNWTFLGHERKLAVSQDMVMIQLIWPLEW